MRGVCRGPQAPPVPTLPGQAGACTLRALSMDLVAQPGVGASPRLLFPPLLSTGPFPRPFTLTQDPRGPFPLSRHQEPHRDCPERMDLMTISKVSLWREVAQPWGDALGYVLLIEQDSGGGAQRGGLSESQSGDPVTFRSQTLLCF